MTSTLSNFFRLKMKMRKKSLQFNKTWKKEKNLSKTVVKNAVKSHCVALK